MFDKPLDKLTIDDITQLVDVLKTPEGQFVDYKRELDTSVDAKKELVNDMSGFGNSQGGYLIIGVDEKDGIPTQIVGTDKSVGRQKIDEWINSVISANTDPKLSYAIKVLPYKKDKVVVVIHLKNSPKKPHMNTYDKRNTYFRRHLDITSPATNQEVRDMFAEAQSTQDRLANFMDSRHLRDTQFMEFAQTNNASSLITSDGEDTKLQDRRFCLFSLIPAVIGDDIVDPVVGQTREWINSNSKGYAPISGRELYRTHKQVIDIDGITFPDQLYRSEGPAGFRSYMEFLSNGYVEFGVSRQLFGSVPDSEGNSRPLLNLTRTVILAHAMINFANKYYPSINYDDQVYLQISLHNVRDVALNGFDTRPLEGGKTWASPYTWHYETPPTLKSSRNLRVLVVFTPSGENKSDVGEDVYSIATQLSRAFGLDIVKSFNDERTFDPNILRQFSILS
jgi:hypothetical protein